MDAKQKWEVTIRVASLFKNIDVSAQPSMVSISCKNCKMEIVPDYISMQKNLSELIFKEIKTGIPAFIKRLTRNKILLIMPFIISIVVTMLGVNNYIHQSFKNIVQDSLYVSISNIDSQHLYDIPIEDNFVLKLSPLNRDLVLDINQI